MNDILWRFTTECLVLPNYGKYSMNSSICIFCNTTYNNTMKDELNNYHARKEFWSSSLAVGSKEWIEGLAVYIPRNKRELSKVNSEVEGKAMEGQSTYLLKTSKRNAVSFTRSLK